MAERLYLNQSQLTAVREVGQEALGQVVKYYGEGFPRWRGVMQFRYHNGHHTQKTAMQGKAIAANAGMDKVGQEVTNSACLSHDVIFTRTRGEDERDSAEWIKERFLLRGVPKVAAEIASIAIIGSEPIFGKDGSFDQKVNRMSFPSWEAAIAAKSLASGDMGELVSPYGPYFSHQLYAEIQATPMGLSPPMEGLVSFQGRQVNLVQDYKYPMGKVAEAVVDPFKLRSRVFAYQKHTYEQLVRGDIESWDQLLAQDLRFAEDPMARF